MPCKKGTPNPKKLLLWNVIRNMVPILTPFDSIVSKEDHCLAGHLMSNFSLPWLSHQMLMMSHQQH
jgi:hypothetical protein